MTPQKILIGQILVVFAIIIAATWAATQWAAHLLGYQTALGPAWFSVGGAPVYYPWRLYEWWYAFEAYAPNVFNAAGTLAAAGGLLGLIAAVIGSLWRARQAKNVTTYGSSRWATATDIERTGLFEPAGVFLGRFKSRYLRHDGPEHVMAFAPTRSGKGVGLVVPTLLSWTGSAVVHDIKGENWQLTAGWRSKFSHCIYFNPADPKSARFNPLLEVRRGLNEERDVRNIADILVDPEGRLDTFNHWQATAHALLTGAILHVLYAKEDKALASVARLLSDPSRPIERTLYEMLTTNHIGTDDQPQVHPRVAKSARQLFNMSENERSGVVSTANTYLARFAEPIMGQVTAACDWHIDDLVNAAKPVSLYLVVPPSDTANAKPLIRLMLNQIGRRLTEELAGVNGADRRHQLLLMLDEFSTLGRLDFFETALAYIAGYGIRAYLIAQSLNQINRHYGENNSILDNCHVRIAFAANDDRTARRISDSLGTATELRAQRNYAGHRLAPWLSHVMVSRQETARPLLTPGEVMQLPANDALVLLSGQPPIRANKLRYYKDRNFIERVMEPPALSEDGHARKPSTRSDDWTGLVRGIDKRLAAQISWSSLGAGEGSEGGLSQHPSLPEDGHETPPRNLPDPLSVLDDEFDTPAATPNIGPAQRLTPIQRAHGLNRGRDDEILPAM